LTLTPNGEKQRLAIAHMDVEQQLNKRRAHTPRDLFTPGSSPIHGLLYSILPEGDRFTEDGKLIVPGQYRRDDVTTGQHLAPSWKNVEAR
jgi:hypothetical protein